VLAPARAFRDPRPHPRNFLRLRALGFLPGRHHLFLIVGNQPREEFALFGLARNHRNRATLQFFVGAIARRKV
jgi:hypothetical protein